MKRGCLLALLLYGGLLAVYYRLLVATVDPPELWIASAVVALLSWLAIGAITNAWTALRERAQVNRARWGLPLKDGQRAAVTGTIQPVGEPLTAPFSWEPCVLYEYELTQQVQTRSNNRTQTSEMPAYTGVAMTPCAIQTAQGPVRLRGFPILDRFSKQYFNDDATLRRARDYLEHVEPQDATGLKILSALMRLKHLLTAADEEVRFDWRNTNDPVDQLLRGRPQRRKSAAGSDDVDLVPGGGLSETRVKVGQAVVAMGLYNAAEQAIVPSVGRHGVMVQLIPGDADKIAAELGASMRRRLVGGSLALVVIHAAFFGVHHLYRTSPDTQREWRDEVTTAVKEDDVDRVAKVLARGLDVDARDSDQRTLLMQVESSEMARLLVERGADVNARDQQRRTPLMYAVRHEQPEVARVLIEAGADLDARDEYYATALVRAHEAGSHEMAALLRAAGAHDDRVTAADGHPLPEGGGRILAVVEEYLEAIYTADVARLVALSSPRRGATFEDADWAVLRSVRPREPELIEGYFRDDEATLTVHGPTEAGFTAIWIFQLVLEDDEWHVLREHWVTR